MRRRVAESDGVVIIRHPGEEEAALLTELALRSKAHWGYPDDFIEACRDELTVSPDQCHRYFCADDGADILGFYGIAPLDNDRVELDALFVEPSVIGHGIGKALIEHAIAAALAQGASRMTIQGDPNARSFYVAAGARQVGERPSGSIPGRQLPVFEIALKA